jgi:hypothetical protein
MQTKLLFLLVVLTGSVLITSAQEAKQEQPGKKGCFCSFSSINQLGGLYGSKGTYFQLQTINGIHYKTWFAGVGVGADYYFRKGFPVFLDIRKDIFEKRSTPFLYADAGIHLVQKRKEKESQWYQNTYSNGFYGDAGIGYKLELGTTSGLLVSAGYSYKNVNRRYEYIFGCGTSRCYENYFTYNNYLHRFSLKLGLQF